MEQKNEKHDAGAFQGNVWDGTVATSFDGGTGTEDSPYMIATGAQLAYLARSISSGAQTDETRPGAYYKLTANIDLAEHRWVPIGKGKAGEGCGFCGIFDGNGHCIMNLNIHNAMINTGLFGYITTPEGSPYTIRNLTVREANVVGSEYTSILAGYITGLGIGSPKIQNCHVSGKLIGKQYIGGIAGQISYSTIENCSADVIISSLSHGTAGAVVGEAFSTFISTSSAAGSINGKFAIGGFAGILFWDTIVKKCSSTTQVTAFENPCGSFAGKATGYYGTHGVTISDSVADGNLTCGFPSTNNPEADGFIGKQDENTCSNCTFTGEIIHKPIHHLLR